MRYLLLSAALLAGSAHAYTTDELRGDCIAADDQFAGQKSSDPYQAIRSARCIAYVAGIADGYAVGYYLAEKIGVRLGAFCLPNDPDLSLRLVRAVRIHVERTPATTTASTATLVAGALAKTFPCPDSLESKK